MTTKAIKLNVGFTMKNLRIVTALLLWCGATTFAADQPATEKLVVDLGDNVTMEFVLVRPGTFTMGDEEAGSLFPLRKVTLTQPFYLGKYEVTQEQWEKVIGSNPSNFKGAKNPVETVSWDDCQSFLAKLKEKAPGHQFALPTEAQWEYACRAGSATDPGNL